MNPTVYDFLDMFTGMNLIDCCIFGDVVYG